MEHILVRTNDGHELDFRGENAETVYKAINDAGIRGSKWTTPAKLVDGHEIVFIVDNISSFIYE